MEVVYCYMRESPMPFGDHQLTVVRLLSLLDAHVRPNKLGKVCYMDVVLDREAGLVLQPDLFFISTERLGILRERVWGAPDLVVEVASPSTEYRDRTLKTAWYRRYGVRECWRVYPKERRIEVVDFEHDTSESFAGSSRVRSQVLPAFNASVDECFE
jgi:Uma2 family endonuclease